MSLSSKLYLLNMVLKTPQEALFTFLIFILGVELGASPFQLMIMACIKPITSLFSFFSSAMLDSKPGRIRPYLIINILLGSIPSLFFPLTDNVWYYIGAYALMMISSRADYPVWIECLKKSDQFPKISKIFSRGTSIEFAILTTAPTLMAYGMDLMPGIWKWFYPIAAVVKLSSIGLVLCLKLNENKSLAPKENTSLQSLIATPLLKGWRILKEKTAFTHYLVLFFIGGAAIIGTQSILPIFFKDELQISYTELGVAFSFCKGIAFIATSPLWSRLVVRYSLYFVNSLMNLFSCLFFILLLASTHSLFWIYLAYLFYGTMQAGCKLSWNLSGVIFSEDDESTFYSSLNLLLVGIRGMLCPCLGFFIYSMTDANTVFLLAIFLSALGIAYGIWADTKALSIKPKLAAQA